MGTIAPILSLYTLSLGPIYHKILRPPLIYNKMRLSRAAVYPSSPCKNCSPSLTGLTICSDKDQFLKHKPSPLLAMALKGWVGPLPKPDVTVSMDMCKKSTLFLLFGADFLIVIVRAKTPHLQAYRNSQRTVARSMHPWNYIPIVWPLLKGNVGILFGITAINLMNLSLATVQQTAKLITCSLTSMHFRINIRINRVMIFIMLGMARYKAVSRNTFSNQDNGHHIKRVLQVQLINLVQITKKKLSNNKQSFNKTETHGTNKGRAFTKSSGSLQTSQNFKRWVV